MQNEPSGYNGIGTKKEVVMAIITISRGTFSGGQSLAKCVAEKLGYRCISREVLVEAAKQYGVQEEDLYKALSEKPGILERLTLERVHYLAYIRAALIKEAKDNDLVYHGHAGHLLLRGTPYILRIKVIANMEFRIKAAMDLHNYGREEAIQFIHKVDDERAKWTRFLYRVDWNDPSTYDIVINLDRLALPAACDIICHMSNLEGYETTPESQKIMDDQD
jgi:cytidylate kinase